MDREQKVSVVDSLKGIFEKDPFIVLVHYRGLSAADMYGVRRSLKEKGANIQVVKNTLLRLAVAGTEKESLSEYFEGPTAVSYSEDPVALAKVLVDFVKDNDVLQVRTGYLNNELLDMSGIKKLAKLGSLEDVRAGLIGTLNAASSNFVRMLNAPASSVVGALNNYAASKE